MKKSLLLALVLSAMSVSAQAAGWFVGADAGQSRYASAGLTDSGATSYGVNGGYAYNDNLAVEVAYTDLGRVAAGAVPVKAKVADMAAVGTYNVSPDFTVFGRLGYASVNTSAAGTSISHDSLTYGAGVSYSLTDAVSLRGGVNRYNLTGSDHANNINAGLRYSFK